MFNKLSSIVLVSFCLFVNISFAKDQDRKVKAEMLLDSTRLAGSICYYENQAYSRGALLSVKINDKTVQLKCDVINNFELNGTVGWVNLLNESEDKHTNKISINRE